MQFKSFLTYLTVTILILSSTTTVVAQSIALNLEKIKPLTPIEFMPQEEFEGATTLFEDTPYDDEFLSFQVRLPNEWEETTQPNMAIFNAEGNLSQNVLGVVKRYVGPVKNHQQSYFSIEAIELIHEIGARDWFIHYVLKSGLSIEQVGLEAEKQVEAIYVEIENDITYIVRVKVIVNGPRMIVARYHLPQENYKEERELQAQVIDSFQLTNRQDVSIESMKTHGFLDQSFFDYPVSWAINAPNVRSINRMKATLYHGTPQIQLAGQINIFLSNKSIGTTRGKELAYYKDKIIIDDYELSEFIGPVEVDYHEDINFGMVQAYKLKSTMVNLIDYELWVSVMENDKYIYVISLLTPDRNEDFYTWARNKEAYRSVLETVRINDVSLDKYRFLN